MVNEMKRNNPCTCDDGREELYHMLHSHLTDEEIGKMVESVRNQWYGESAEQEQDMRVVYEFIISQIMDWTANAEDFNEDFGEDIGRKLTEKEYSSLYRDMCNSWNKLHGIHCK